MKQTFYTKIGTLQEMTCGILGQVWYLIVLIPNLCHLSYFLHNIIKHHYLLSDPS